MQKVITITSRTYVQEGFSETEYPKLANFLEEGYTVVDTIPFKDASTSFWSITFILVK